MWIAPFPSFGVRRRLSRRAAGDDDGGPIRPIAGNLKQINEAMFEMGCSSVMSQVKLLVGAGRTPQWTNYWRNIRMDSRTVGGRIWPPAAALLVFIAVWEAACRWVPIIEPYVLPSPSAIVEWNDRRCRANRISSVRNARTGDVGRRHRFCGRRGAGGHPALVSISSAPRFRRL